MKKPKTYDKITGAWVKEQRIKAGMTQDELADTLELCGRSHVCRIEKTSVMSMKTKKKLFAYFVK